MKPMRHFSCAAILLLSVQVFAGQRVPNMAVDADPSYEVATIKPSLPDEEKTVQVRGTRFVTTDTSLIDLMTFAYGVHQLQIAGGPDWLRTRKYDLVVQPNLPGRPSTPQLRSILQKLLADRFHLVFHHAQTELTVYRLLQAKGGGKLTATSADSASKNGAFIGIIEGGVSVTNATLPEFASLMERYVSLDKPIVDHTGITGKFDYNLKWTPDFSQFDGKPPWAVKPDGSASPSLYTAIQEQLGLKLEPAKERADTLVIDRADEPTGN